MVFVLGERYGLLVAVYHNFIEQRAVLDEVARVAVCLGPLADNGWRDIIEFARQALRFEEAAEVVPEPRVVVPQCRRELVGCAIPLPASRVGGGVDEVASVELAVSLRPRNGVFRNVSRSTPVSWPASFLCTCVDMEENSQSLVGSR